MDSSRPEVSHEVPPYLRVYKDGTIERLFGNEVAPASFDHQTGVESKDTVITPETGVSARLYRPIAKAKIILISVDYRRAPEHPLPAAYEDSWAAFHAGANIAHHLAIRARSNPVEGMILRGIIMIQPYFWGEIPIGSEAQDPVRKAMVDGWWRFVCLSDRGNDDPLINPVADGAPSLSGLACDRVIICVAGKDILRDRGRLYYESLVKSEWLGKAEIVEIEGEDHVFHIMDPNCEKALYMMECLASFINQE
ncbi:alpha/beta-Hydrolases superfamily protein [Actinidia rufa]|uniref:Alpha/beta-Hydrolases superfamily protein n=1 Tax=Actinidia rufa TaxID=165716 RepID=A0A7J0FB62_9ERIC|nr:alpha/beta-Hydrolases superfamily protein [Actinidia rufa]